MRAETEVNIIKELGTEIFRLAKDYRVSPADLINFTAIALVNLQVTLSKPGMRHEAFESMIDGMRAAFKVLAQEETIQ
jgi:hypothetical protein